MAGLILVDVKEQIYREKLSDADIVLRRKLAMCLRLKLEKAINVFGMTLQKVYDILSTGGFIRLYVKILYQSIAVDV